MNPSPLLDCHQPPRAEGAAPSDFVHHVTQAPDGEAPPAACRRPWWAQACVLWHRQPDAPCATPAADTAGH